MNDTRTKLLDATDTVLREDGIGAVSARAVATRAGVNQALVFYHFGTVAELVDLACRTALDARVAAYADRFDAIDDIEAFLALARELNAEERRAGNVAMMAQLLAAGQHDEALASTARYCLGQWSEQVERVLRRVLRSHPVADLIDVGGLAHAVTCGFVGVELMQGVEADGADAALATLDQIAALLDVFDDLGPVARRAVASRLRRGSHQRRR
ncbi:TetR family transcriptional regulator [Allobranchiibius sp. GilTou38]|uniref:TetR/AcrR family transcriptional regulator n=1 Tax=Allobranchiibius sp. GilTou38 TaxID=2815210 RepID=UPI001AA1BA0F|nr:TetR family transcriptional regulator [Allobranchiibius sp. GilTou38]MBO1765640.1 TetR family transcriptional regulator [Allobranchiibius sp. GilTou38]